jgi:hemin uptake protein HemP
MTRQERSGRTEEPQPLPLAATSSGQGKPRRATSDELLGQAGELIIVHGEREYRLRRTANGKLILTA